MKKPISVESITVQASHKDIRIPCERLRDLLADSGVVPDDINLCELALQELLANLVDHSYKDNPAGLITVTFTYNSNQLLIETQDTGDRADVDLSKVEMPDPADLAEGGYGLAIIQTVMDEVKYTYEHGRNNWQLIKNLQEI